MEDVEDNPFNSQALSFDSTLDSLLDGEFVPDDKTVPFEPSSEILMSAQKCYRADIGQNGDGDVNKDAEVETVDADTEPDVSESPATQNGIVHDSVMERDITCIYKTSPEVSELPDKFVNSSVPDDLPSKINVNASNAGVREPSPNFDKIKAKRKRNLANQKSNVSSVHKTLSNDNKSSKASKQSDVKVQNECTEEPPTKRKRSNEPNSKNIVSKPLDSKCPFDSTDMVNNTGHLNVNHKLNKSETGEPSIEKAPVIAEDLEISSEINTTFESSSGISDVETSCPYTKSKDIVVDDAINENDDTVDESEANTTLVEDLDKIIANNKDNDENLNELTADSDNEDDDSDEEEYVDDDEIHGWLEEGVTKPEKKKVNKEDLKDGEFICRDKHILEEKGINPFEVLPTGWLMITHDSGMPVYLHKPTRVCTFSRPYFIGSGSSRKHDIPLSAIPCLQYRRELKKDEETKAATENEAPNKNEEVNNEDNGIEKDILPKAILKSAEETHKMVSLEPSEFNQYCRGLFHFKVVKVKRFKTWREKRAHMVQEKKKKDAQVPKLAADTKLITCPIPPDNSTKKSKKKEFVMNPEGKTAVCILHEYTQNVIRVQPTYEFKEIQNAECPFQATVLISGIQYGSGCASGKRQAKNEAAKATLSIFLPELSPYLEGPAKAKQKDELSSDLNYFEEVAIEDPRVPDLCNKASLPQPYQVLQTCLQRNFGLGDTTFKTDKKLISNQKTEFTLTVGKRHCTVVCKNKREAKQRAAQVMLQQLHPDLKSWAAILRLYSKSSEVGFHEREGDDAAITDFHLEKKKNLEILDKLKSAMRKVKEQRKQYSDGNTVTSVVPAQPLNL